MNIKNQPRAKKANLLSGSDWLKNSFSIWRDLDKTPEERKLNTFHPATFSVSAVSKLIKCYVPKKGMRILDCFAGTGSSLVAAHENGMYGIGFDINEKYKEIFLKRINFFNSLPDNIEYHVEDAKKIPLFVKKETVDFGVTSPPYWNILNCNRSADGKKSVNYSENRNDIGNIADYDFFLKSLLDILEKVYYVLKKEAYFVMNVMDLRKGAVFYPFHMDATKAAQSIGFNLEDIIVWDRQKEYNSMRPLGYPYKFIINKVHEYFLILRK